MASYRLSAEAAEDLGRLYEWGIRNFGLLEADRDYDGLLATLERIGRTPEAFPAVDHVKPGYRRGVYKATGIYFIVPEGTVHIVRILGRQDPGDALKGLCLVACPSFPRRRSRCALPLAVVAGALIMKDRVRSRRRSLRMILLGLFLCSCAAIAEAPGEPFGPSLTLDATGPSSLEVTYRTAEPVRALQLRRVPDGQRAERWRFAYEGFTLVHDPEALTDKIVRADGEAFTSVRVSVPAVYSAFPKGYAAFMPFRKGGLLIHSGRFHACAEACGGQGEPDPADAFAMTVRFPPEERAIVEGRVVTGGAASWTDRRDGTMVYVGRAEPVESAHVARVIDPDLPPAFRDRLDDLFPRLMAYFAARLGPLKAKPMLFVSLDRDAAGDPAKSSFASQGGTLPDQVFMHLRGDGWLEDPAGWSEETKGFVPWFFAHEAAHLYQRSVLGEPSEADVWIHEGGADAFAAIALRDLGVEEPYVRERIEADAGRCEEGLKEGPLSSAAARGAFGLHYACGMTIQLLADAELRASSGGAVTLFDTWEAFLTEVEAGAPWSAATFLDVLSAQGAQEARAMAERMLEEG